LASQDERLIDMINVVALDQLLPYSSRSVAVAFAYEGFEAELRESLKSIASKNWAVGLDGIVEFDIFGALRCRQRSNPIDLYAGWLQSGLRQKRAAH
jgi:hypothetical protein